MDQEQLLALIRYLQSQGVPEKEITNMFGEYFGIEKDKPDYTGMFEKYMPTFAQIESIKDPNSLMKSIAKDISNGVPIWDIKNGIASAIQNNVAGVDPNMTFDEYVSYAKTLEGEFQSYTNQAKEEEAKFGENGTLDISQTYNWRDVFPDQLKQVTDYAKQNPLYKMGAVGSGADMPKVGDVISSTKTTTENSNTSLHKSAEKSLKDALKAGSLVVSFDGKNYSIGEMRDSVIPMLKTRAKDEESKNKKVLQLWKDEAKRLGMSEGGPRVVSPSDPEQRLDKTETFGIPANDAKWKKAQRDFQKGLINEKQFVAAKNDNNTFMENLGRMKGMVSQLSAQQNALLKAKPTFDKVATTSTVNTTVKPGQYIGPRGGESTMAREYNPDLLKFLATVDTGLTKKITDSGRTPAGDRARELALYYSNLKGKP